jgi:hypothetical protein
MSCRRPLAVLVLFALLAALPAAALCAPLAPGKKGPWELVRSDDGIIVHRRVVAGSNLHEFRGVGVVEAPLAAVLGVLKDAEHRTEWMKEAVANIRIESNGLYDETFYSRTGAPWPVQDRDVVNHAHISVDAAAGFVRLEFTSVTHPAWPPQKGVVRMPSLHGHWIMWPEHGGAFTRIEYQLHADPGGMLPGWIVNLVSKRIPHDTLVGMRQQVKRRHYPEFEQRIAAAPEYQAVLSRADKQALFTETP